MRVCIHRGAREVGGICVELESGGSRLLLDLGLPLAAEPDEPVMPPDVEGLVDGGDPSLRGVVVSHAHLDHYGLLPLAHPDLPVFIGEASARIMAEAAFSNCDRPARTRSRHARSLISA